jgi:hypothetical protein
MKDAKKYMRRWDFLYDEPETKPYQSLKDWIKEIKHVLYALLIILLLLITSYFLLMS